MSQAELLKVAVRRLEAAGVDYMLTGSVVSSLQGEPRASHDIDIVIAVRAPAAEVAARFRSAFPEADFYLDEDQVRNAIATRGMFNVIDLHEGDKLDFWLLTDDPFDQVRFGRRYPEVFEGEPLLVSRPEDTILMKLRWAAMQGGSEKQFNDALRVYEVQHGRLDEAYLDCWAVALAVTGALMKLRAQAEPLEGVD